MSIQLFIVCAYIALLFGISFWVKKRADAGSTAFLLASRKLTTLLVPVNVTGQRLVLLLQLALLKEPLGWDSPLAGTTVPGPSVLL